MNKTYNQVIFEEKKLSDFNAYFELTSHTIRYNGNRYLIIESERVLNSFGTDGEVHAYILGYLYMYNNFLKQTNEENERIK